MLIKEILPLSRVETGAEIQSKKAVLEHLSEMLGSDCAELTNMEIFEGLLARERLGSTGLGKGVAIPHGRMAGISTTKGAFLKLQEGVDFDAVDNKPVDMFFALLVPEESTDEHLQILSRLAEMFSDDGFLERLRNQNDSETIFNMLTTGAS